MPILLTESELQNFREQLYNQFEHRADSAMDLLDALCSNNHAPSVVQLSLNPLFRAGYSTLFKTISDGSIVTELNIDPYNSLSTDYITAFAIAKMGDCL